MAKLSFINQDHLSALSYEEQIRISTGTFNSTNCKSNVPYDVRYEERLLGSLFKVSFMEYTIRIWNLPYGPYHGLFKMMWFYAP